MQLSCPNCQYDIPARNVNVDALVAKCGHCNSVFSFASQVETSESSASKRQPVPMPKSITIEDSPNGMTVKRRWFSLTYIGLLFFCIFWDGFLVFWYFIAFTQSSPLMMKIFPIIHVVVGIGITYTTIAGFLNTTRIHVNYQHLSIRHSPMPWPGNREFEADSIEQIYCKRSNMQTNDQYTFNVLARLTEGKKIRLLRGLHDEDEALYIEQELERFLGLEHRNVKGALKYED